MVVTCQKKAQIPACTTHRDDQKLAKSATAR